MCKVRGIILNYSASQVVNFSSIKNVILNEERIITVHTPRKIKRKRERDFIAVISEPQNKIYQVLFKK